MGWMYFWERKHEEELLNKFVLVLNEKKKQIRALQTELLQSKGNKNNFNFKNDGLNDDIEFDMSMDFNEISEIDLNEWDDSVNENKNNIKMESGYFEWIWKW